MKERLLTIGATLLALGAVGGGAFLLATRRFVVEGRSMVPAYQPGEHVLVNRVAYARSRPKKGDVVVVQQAGAGRRADLKRIAAGPGDEVEVRGEKMTLGEEEWFVLGDNAGESTDSRELGPVRTGDIIGKVVLKY